MSTDRLEPDVDLDEPDFRPEVRSRCGTPTWELAEEFFPLQGEWTEKDYFDLDNNTNRQIELEDGCLRFLPRPTIYDQLVAQYVFDRLCSAVTDRTQGSVLFAPLPVRLWEGRYREPDLMFFRPERIRDVHSYPDGADLVIEVVIGGEESRRHDYETKRVEYARAGIAEYWIVDPEQRRITVLTLDGKTYRVHGEFGPGQTATSVLLPGFAVSVDETFAAGESMGTTDQGR